jgi:hypothetical protein
MKLFDINFLNNPLISLNFVFPHYYLPNFRSNDLQLKKKNILRFKKINKII